MFGGELGAWSLDGSGDVVDIAGTVKGPDWRTTNPGLENQIWLIHYYDGVSAQQ
jgi:hypothetical protein